ncbi:MAG: hypothetical protein EXR72_10490 [Myxococcales bacterium]|nr:hypothetical protein [Myxococcales bacterium]
MATKNGDSPIGDLTIKILQQIRDGIDKGFKETNRRLEHLEEGSKETNQRLEHLEEGSRETNERLSHMEERLGGVENGLITLNSRFEHFLTFAGQRQVDHETRILRLEEHLVKALSDARKH